MKAKILASLIFPILFIISKCSATCSSGEPISMSLPNLGDTYDDLIISVRNPYGSVTASLWSGNSVQLTGCINDENVRLSADPNSEGTGYVIEVLTIVSSQLKSSALRNSVSFIYQICLLLMGSFISQRGGNSLIWLLVATGIYVLAAPSVDIEIRIPDGITFTTDTSMQGTTIFTLSDGKFSTTNFVTTNGLTTCVPWPFENNTNKECGGNIKGNCPSSKSCELDPYSENINFKCLDTSTSVDIVGGSHGVSFGYTIPAKDSKASTYKRPGLDGETCSGHLEAMGSCAAGFYCKSGKCVATTKRDGTAGYNEADKASYYCQHATGHTSWVYYFSVEHWCTLEQNKTDGVCQTATSSSSIFGGPHLMDGVARETFQINGTIPGPPIYACVGDTIEVHVTNFNMSTGTTIHWHGMWQRFNQYQDGVAQVTQCPITGAWNGTSAVTGGKWIYTFKAEPAGRTWYHSHTGLQYGDGLFGPMSIYQKNKGSICNLVDNYWDQKTNGLKWAQWKSTWCDPYESEYDGDIDTLLIHDWYHNMSSQMYQGIFFGSTNPSNYGIDTANCKHEYKGTGDFMCTQGGPSGDMPWVSGLINGLGQYSGTSCGPCADIGSGKPAQSTTSPQCETCVEGTLNGQTNPCASCGANNYYTVKVPQVGNTYRMAIINAGQMFGLRFSIDKHTMKIIAQDDMYVKPIDVQQIVVYPGQRVEFLVDMTQSSNQNYWIRARTFPQQSWTWDSDKSSPWYGSFIPGPWRTDSSVKEVLAVLQYNSNKNAGMPPESERSFPETFQTNGTSAINNYVTIKNSNVKSIYNPGQFAAYTAPTVEHHQLSSYYSYTAVPMKQAENMSTYINGIMFPNFQLSMNLAKGIVNITDMNIPVVFARPHVPVAISKGQWGLRNMSLYAGFKEFPPMYGGLGNYTQATYLKGNVANLLYIQNPGPMVHPLHLHGHSFAVLASGRTSKESAQEIADMKQTYGCCREINNPTVKNSSGAVYYDYWSSRWYNPAKSEWADYKTSTHKDASLIIPGVSQRYSDPKPIVDDPYGAGNVNLDSPMIIDTVPIPPHGWALIEFISDNPGSWFFHCHIEFHAGGGMGFVYLTDPDSWDLIYPTTQAAQPGFNAYNNGVGADYCCQDVEFLGPNQYW